MIYMATSVVGQGRITVLQFGPCWCRTRSEPDVAFDLIRHRTTWTTPGLDTHLIVVTERVIAGARSTVARVAEATPEPRLVIATSICPAAVEFWEDLAGGWMPVEEVIPVDTTVDACISAFPEELLATALGSLGGRRAGPASMAVAAP